MSSVRLPRFSLWVLLAVACGATNPRAPGEEVRDVPRVARPDFGEADAAGDAPDEPPACVPDCAGRGCGDDGCGGSCGECAAPSGPYGVKCREGRCVELGLTGAPCADDEACWEGTCLDTWAGRFCTDPCFGCPQGWSCQPYFLIPPDVIYVCLPELWPDCTPTVDRVSLSGYVVQVAMEHKDHALGRVSLLEDQDVEAPVGQDGRFTLEGVWPCQPVTLLLEHPELRAVQSATIFVQNEDLDGLTLQTPDLATWELFVAMSGVEIDPGACQVATTVTRAESWGEGPGWDEGEPGAVVSLTPAMPAAHGPIYFQLGTNGVIYPDPSLSLTSGDGGALFANLPKGEYQLSAEKDGVAFQPARVRCHTGAFVNASPPFGVQGLP